MKVISRRWPLAMTRWILLLWGFSLSLTSCFQDPALEAVFTVDPNNPSDANRFPLLSAALAANPDLSMFNQVATTARLTLPDGSTTSLGGMLTAYGAYTVFAPNNAAMQVWLDSRGISLSSLKTAQDDPELNQALSDLLLYHICLDSVPTSNFVDGKFPAKTVLGSYLLMKLKHVGDNKVSYTLNRLATVDTAHMNIRCRNGYMNVIDKVLTPEGRGGGDVVASLGSEYSIFKTLMAETGVDEVLNIRRDTLWAPNRLSYTISPRSYTVFAMSDSVFNANGISSYDGLSAWLDTHRGTGDERPVNDLLVGWAQYHVVDQLLFTSDIVKQCNPRVSHTTLCPSEPMMFNYVAKKIRVNRDEKALADVVFNRGIFLDMAISDVSFANGVLHYALGLVTPVQTAPTPVYWDFGDTPGWNDHPSYRKKVDISVTGQTLPNFQWGGGTAVNFALIGNKGSNYLYGNVVDFAMGWNRVRWVVMKTPTINKGTYKVWITYFANNNGNRNPCVWWYHLLPEYFNTPGQELYDKVYSGVDGPIDINNLTGVSPITLLDNGKIGKMMENKNWRWGMILLPNPPTGAAIDSDEDALMNKGWKWATARTRNQSQACHYLGTITVTATGPQRFMCANNWCEGGSPNPQLDAMQFIPIDMDQMYPKIDGCGKLFQRSDFDADSQPFDNTLNVASNDPWNCVVDVVEEPLD